MIVAARFGFTGQLSGYDDATRGPSSIRCLRLTDTTPAESSPSPPFALPDLAPPSALPACAPWPTSAPGETPSASVLLASDSPAAHSRGVAEYPAPIRSS